MPDAFRLSDRLAAELADGRSIPLDALIVPRDVHLDGARLEFAWGPPITATPAPSNLIGQFVSARSNEQILEFARGFGCLDLELEDKVWIPQPQKILDRVVGASTRREPLRAWQAFRLEVEAILDVVTSWRDHRNVSDQSLDDLANVGLVQRYHWATVNPYSRSAERALKAWPTLPTQRRQNAAVKIAQTRLQELAAACGVRPALMFRQIGTGTSGSRKVDLIFQDNAADRLGAGLSLAGALVVQMLAAAAGARFFLCSGCGNTFSPTRSPATNRNQYCKRCRSRGVPIRKAKEKYRRKIREKNQLTSGIGRKRR